MKLLVFGAVLGILWLLFGLPTMLPAAVITFACKPVILAFAAGLAARPHLTGVGEVGGMTELNPLAKAEAAAVEAAQNSDLVQQIVVALKVQQVMQGQQPTSCQHQHAPQSQFDARKWWTIGGLAIVGGCVACAMAMAFAVAMVAVAIGATCSTVCLLILRQVWRDYLKNR